MADFPFFQTQPPTCTISSMGRCSLGEFVTVPFKGSWINSTAWTTANRAIYIPFIVSTQVTAFKMAFENGATLNGNVDVGIYDFNGNRLTSIGSGTAQTGVSVIQIVDIGDVTLTPGYYFMAMSTNSTTATYLSSPTANGTGDFFRSCGIQEQLTAFPLPNPATFANPATTTTRIPNLAIATNAVI